MIKENDIVTFKMTSGDEVVARLKAQQDNHGYEVTKPHGVMMSQNGFSLIPWILTIDPDSKVFITWNSVASVTKTFDRVAKEYVKQTTGLIV